MQKHEHGRHDCYCPTCSYVVCVEEYQKCNQLYCPLCGDRLRAVETGEYRGIGQLFPDNPMKTVAAAILTGVGLGIGYGLFDLARKKGKTRGD